MKLIWMALGAAIGYAAAAPRCSCPACASAPPALTPLDGAEVRALPLPDELVGELAAAIDAGAKLFVQQIPNHVSRIWLQPPGGMAPQPAVDLPPAKGGVIDV